MSEVFRTLKEAVIVAIDGPSGVGKSTVARHLAKRLRIPMLDTGAMYRAAALEAIENDLDPADGEAVEGLMRELDLELRTDGEGGIEVLLRGEPVGQRIRTPEISLASSQISAHSAVRRKMVDLQRLFARRAGAVLEGRDIGTVVFPDTPFKFFLTADLDVRAERRHRDLLAAGRGMTLEQVASELEQRDGRDTGRANSPLVSDESYFEIDTSDLLPAEIVERMVGVIRRTLEQRDEAEKAGAKTEKATAADIASPGTLSTSSLSTSSLSTGKAGSPRQGTAEEGPVEPAAGDADSASAAAADEPRSESSVASADSGKEPTPAVAAQSARGETPVVAGAPSTAASSTAASSTAASSTGAPSRRAPAGGNRGGS